MSWPLASHFSAMLQNPRLAFRDPTLRECRITKDERNQPRPWSGAFAVVYKGISAIDDRPFAVRIFTTESPERALVGLGRGESFGPFVDAAKVASQVPAGRRAGTFF